MIKEPYFAEYVDHLEELSKVIKSTGEPLEGNLFYHHHADDLRWIYEPFRMKRIYFSAFCLRHDFMVEIGFNAGHSALLALTANPQLTYVAIDLFATQYSNLCFDYLKSVFKSRIIKVVGDSKHTVPDILHTVPQLAHNYTTWVIDGGHDNDVVLTDLANVIQVAKTKECILVDDFDYQPVTVAVNTALLKDQVKLVMSTANQVCLEVNK